MKKILSLLLAITLIFGVLPMSAFADEPNAEPKTDIIDIIGDTVDDPVEDQTDPVEDPTEDPVEDPTEDQTDDPTDNPTNTINATNGGGMILVDSGDGCTCDSFCDDPDCVVCKDDPTKCAHYYCICEAVCAEGEANPACPVCKDDYSKCAQAVTAPQIAPMGASSVNSVSLLNAAIIGFNDEDNTTDYTIEISGNFDTNSTSIAVINNVNNPTKKLIIKSTGGPFTITRNTSGNLFTVISGELVLENITIDGSKGSFGTGGGTLVDITSNGKLTMNSGATLQNNNNASTDGGGVYVNGGTFTMNSGTISGNTTTASGGGVYVALSGVFTMNNGTITGNSSTISNMGGGGGVYSSSGTVTMNNGTISGNNANYGGGLYISVGTFTMGGGTISGNTAPVSGGGVYNRVDMTMTNGTISGNTAGVGGGVLHQTGTFTMTSGTISNNVSNATTYGGGVSVFGGTFSMSGNASITGNTAANNGGGVYVVMSGATFTIKDSAQITCGVYLDGSNSPAPRTQGGGSSAKITLAGALTPTASIGIEGMGVTDPGTIVATNASASDMAKFFISNAARKIGDNNGFVLSGSDIVLGTVAPPAPTPSSGGSSKKEKPAPAPSPWLDPTPAQKMSNDAKHKDSDLVRTKSSDLYGVRKDAWQKLKGYRFIHDTMDGDTVGVRVSINEPEKIKQDLLVSGYVKGASANSRKAQFEKWFNNKIHVIHFDQTGAWGQPVGIAAKIDPNQFDSLNNLFFYSYDKNTKKYTRIERQSNHWLDNKGYLHFTTELAGDIIISEGPLEKK